MTGLLAAPRPLAELYDAALMDLDGVMYAGRRAIMYAPEAVTAAREAGQRLMYVTNNASRTPADVGAHLRSFGVQLDDSDVYTAAMAGAALARARHGVGARVLIVGGSGLTQAAVREGLVAVETAADEPACVLQGFAPTVGWPELTEAAYAVARGAEHIATNLDSTLPLEGGNALGNGALVAAVVHATGVRPLSAGKPNKEIFELAIGELGASSPLAVGDRLGTDIAGARAAGIPALHVLTGISSAREVVLAAPDERPSYLGLDLRDLLAPHPAVTQKGDWFHCRHAAASIVDGVAHLLRSTPVVVDGPSEITHDEYRALACAAWQVGLSDCPELRVNP